MRKLLIYFLFIFLFLFIFSSFSYSAWGEPELVTKLNKAFETIEEWLLKLATPAAAVAVGTGVFMRKFSFGDEEKIRTGKNIIRGSLFCYVFILVLDMVLSAIQTLVK